MNGKNLINPNQTGTENAIIQIKIIMKLKKNIKAGKINFLIIYFIYFYKFNFFNLSSQLETKKEFRRKIY